MSGAAESADRLPTGRRVRLTAEIIVLFYGLPLAYVLGARLWWMPISVLVVSIVATVVALVVLLRDPTFDPTRLTRLRPIRRDDNRPSQRLGEAAVLFAVACIVFTAGVAYWMPDRLFDLPRHRPGLWLLVVTLYPPLSGYPQELIWRALLFHRYGPLFGKPSWTIGASALAFGWAHVVMLNPLAVLSTLAGGLIFGRRYVQTGSVLRVTLEHSLYGLLIFTIGLGAFFIVHRA